MNKNNKPSNNGESTVELLYEVTKATEYSVSL